MAIFSSSRLCSQKIWSCVSSWSTTKLRSSSKPGSPQGNAKTPASLNVPRPKRGKSIVLTALSAGALTIGLLVYLEIIDQCLAFESRRGRVGPLQGGLNQRELRRGLSDVRVLDRGLRSYIIVRKNLKLRRGSRQVLDLLPDLSPRREHLVDYIVDIADLRRQVARHTYLIWNLEGFEEVRGRRARDRHRRGRR